MLLYYVLLLLTPFGEYSRLPTFGDNLTLIKAVGLLALAPAMLRMACRAEPVRMWAYAEGKLFFVFTGMVLVSTIVHWPRTSITPLMSFASFLLYFFITVAMIDSFERMRRAFLIVAVSMFIASVYVYNEYFRWHSQRPSGIVGDPNYYALIGVTVLPLCVLLMPTAGKIQKAFLAVTAISTAISILLGGSRAGLLGVGVCFLYLIARVQAKMVLLTTGLVLGAILFAVLPASPLTRLLNPDTEAVVSTNVRKDLLRAGWAMVRDHPWFGVGVGRFRTLATRYNPDLPAGRIAHNTYLGIAAELGIPASLIFTSILVLAWRRARRLSAFFKQRNFALGEHMAKSVEIGVLSFGISAVFLSAENVKHCWILIFFGITMSRLLEIQKMRMVAPPAAAHPPARHLRPARALPAALCSTPSQ